MTLTREQIERAKKLGVEYFNCPDGYEAFQSLCDLALQVEAMREAINDGRLCERPRECSYPSCMCGGVPRAAEAAVVRAAMRWDISPRHGSHECVLACKALHRALARLAALQAKKRRKP